VVSEISGCTCTARHLLAGGPRIGARRSAGSGCASPLFAHAPLVANALGTPGVHRFPLAARRSSVAQAAAGLPDAADRGFRQARVIQKVVALPRERVGLAHSGVARGFDLALSVGGSAAHGVAFRSGRGRGRGRGRLGHRASYVASPQAILQGALRTRDEGPGVLRRETAGPVRPGLASKAKFQLQLVRPAELSAVDGVTELDRDSLVPVKLENIPMPRRHGCAVALFPRVVRVADVLHPPRCAPARRVQERPTRLGPPPDLKSPEWDRARDSEVEPGVPRLLADTAGDTEQVGLRLARDGRVPPGKRVVEGRKHGEDGVSVRDPETEQPGPPARVSELNSRKCVLRGTQSAGSREAAVLPRRDLVRHGAMETGILYHESPESAGPRDVGDAAPRAAQDLPHGAAARPGVVGANPLEQAIENVGPDPPRRVLLRVLPVEPVKVIDGVPAQELHVPKPVLPAEDVAHLELAFHDAGDAVV